MLGCQCSRWFFVIVIIVCFGLFLRPASAVGQSKKHKAPVHILDEDVPELDQQLLSVRSYALEDFFWTGSGDGAPPPQGPPPPQHTTTLLATVFLDKPGPDRPPSSSEEDDEDCVSECPISPGPVGPISPTGAGPGAGLPPPDQRYWLLTVLRAPTAPALPDLDSRLANLYRKAFLRQQERHLGIIPTSPSGTRKKHQISVHHFDENNNSTVETYNKSDNSFNIYTTSSNTGLNTVFSTLPQDEENFEDIEDSSISTNSDLDYSVDVPFEYVTKYLESTPSSVLRVKRSVEGWDKSADGLVSNRSAEGNVSSEVVKRDTSKNGQPMVEVFLQNITKEGSEELKVVYWVSVGGRPVPARTAAKDMKLMADAEVVAELGYPITTKAEPYLKSPEHLNGAAPASSMQDTWLIVGSIILACILLLVAAAFLACRLGGRRKGSGGSRVLREASRTADNTTGKENMAYQGEKDGKLVSVVSPGKQKGTQVTEERYVSPARRYVRGPHYLVNRVSSAESSASTSSGSDLSQMNATLRQRQRVFEQQMQNEYAIVNKKNKTKHRRIRSKKVGIADYSPRAMSPEDIRGDGSLQRFLVSGPPSPASPGATSHASSSSSCSSVAVRRPRGVVSPTSYLSMPSVKSFPRNNAVEPLSKVLEPLCVRHLDMDSPVHQTKGDSNRRPHDSSVFSQQNKVTGKGDSGNHGNQRESEQKKSLPSIMKNTSGLIRLGSLDKDPGVVSPMVWDMHKQRIKDSNMDPRNEADSTSGANISKMRQRFSELVDDAFSLFGSGTNTPKSTGSARPEEVTRNLPRADQLPSPLDLDTARRHSTKEGNYPVGVHASEARSERPLTALPPRPPLPRQGTAWGSTTMAPMSRSTSAGAQRRPGAGIIPAISGHDPASLSPRDPALPLLQAIRTELSKLPGTSDA